MLKEYVMKTIKLYIVDYGWCNTITIEANDTVLSGKVELHRWFEAMKKKYDHKWLRGNSYMDYDTAVYEFTAAVMHELDSQIIKEI
jgi:hypothetical protein